MDPGARAALIVALLAAIGVLAAAAFVAPAAPALAAVAGVVCGWIYVRYTRRELPKRKGQGGVIAAPLITLAQAAGAALNLFLLGGGVRIGARLTHVGVGTDSMDMPLSVSLPLLLMVTLLTLAMVLVGGEVGARWAAKDVTGD